MPKQTTSDKGLVTRLQNDLDALSKASVENQAVLMDAANRHAARAEHYQAQLSHVNSAHENVSRNMVESLLQERTDLLGRLMRVEQRLRVFGIQGQEGTPSSFDLAANAD